MGALAGIIGTHVVAWAGRGTPESDLWFRGLELITRSGVTCFVLLNGVLVGYGERRSQQPGAWLKRRWSRIGVPWLFWGTVWVAMFMVFRSFWLGESYGELWDYVNAYLSGPGYLYFLVLLGQLTVVTAFYPGDARARGKLAVALVGLQLLLTQGRLLVPDGWGGDVWAFIDGYSYELAPFWIGDFALGVVAGMYLRRIEQPTVLRVVGVLGAWVVCAAGIIFAPELGWWNEDRLSGASALLHPMNLPLACCEVLLLLWLGHAIFHRRPGWAASMSAAGELTFGVYLVQQYTLEAIGPLFQTFDPPFLIADVLPNSLPAVAGLYLATVVSSALVTVAIRTVPWGRAVLGGQTGRAKPAAARR